MPGLSYNSFCVREILNEQFHRHALLAQLVEHLTLNQGVQGSNPWRRTKDTVFADIAIAAGTVFFLYLCGLQGCKANRHGAPFFMSFRSTRAPFLVHFLDTYPSVKYCFLLQWFHGRNAHIFLLSRCFHVPSRYSGHIHPSFRFGAHGQYSSLLQSCLQICSMIWRYKDWHKLQFVIL